MPKGPLIQLSNLTSIRVADAITRAKYTRNIAVMIPKFEVKTKLNMQPIFRGAGFDSMFDPLGVALSFSRLQSKLKLIHSARIHLTKTSDYRYQKVSRSQLHTIKFNQ